MNTWREEKQLVEISLKLIKEIIWPQVNLEVRTSGSGRLWKSVYKNGTNISEGYKTWHEVSVFISGLRRGLGI
jgi:hypothetical protein